LLYSNRIAVIFRPKQIKGRQFRFLSYQLFLVAWECKLLLSQLGQLMQCRGIYWLR